MTKMKSPICEAGGGAQIEDGTKSLQAPPTGNACVSSLYEGAFCFILLFYQPDT